MILFKATDNSDEKISNVTLFIDSKSPKIISKEPKSKAIVNGSSFSVKYEEDNLKSITLYYSNKSITRTDCESGKNKICMFNIPASELENYDGEYIDYKFELNDVINTESSKNTKVKIDITPPSIDITSPVDSETYNYKTKVPIILSVSEDSLVQYYDNSEFKPSWKTICSKCHKYSSTKTFTRGSHDISIRAIDSAGNSQTEEISFEVV